MLHTLGNIIRWLWEVVLLPNVILALAALVSDGTEAWADLGRSLKVLLYLLLRRSHRSFPVRVRVAPVRGTVTIDTVAHPGTSTDSGKEDASSDPSRVAKGSESSHPPVVSLEADRPPSPDSDVRIHRRIQFGRRGEQQEWLEEAVGHLLVPITTALCYSQSLHRLVRCVIGSVQLPTVSTLPSRHHAPQWPPHFVRSAKNVRRGVVGDYSSASATGHSATDFGDSNSSATDSITRSTTAGYSQYRQAARVVYRKVSTRHLELRQSRSAAHPIASITAHHVLSYQATRQKVLVMDLDETLCHVAMTTAHMQGPPTFSEVIPTASGAELFHVWVRPHANLFLTTMAKLFNLVLFTSASKPYADTILRRIDPNRLLKERYYRQDCRVVPRGVLANAMQWNHSTTPATAPSTSREDTSLASSEWSDAPWRSDAATSSTSVDASTTPLVGCVGGRTVGVDKVVEKPVMNTQAKVLVKDLRLLKVPPELVIMIDNCEECTLLNRDNALIIPPYIPTSDTRKVSPCKPEDGDDAGGDEVLLGLVVFMESLLVVPDVRSILRLGKIY